MTSRLLIVEDAAGPATSLEHGFRAEGFAVSTVASVTAARAELAINADVVILDLGVPDFDGLELLTWAREAGLALPILVLTAHDAVSSRVAALDCGADDYLVKPFVFPELLVRVRSLIHCVAAPRSAPVVLAGLRLEAGEPLVAVGRRRVRLSPRERALLEHLVRRRGKVVTRHEILDAVFGYDFDPGTNLIDVHISHLRRKIAGGGVVLETVRGFGFRLTARPEIYG